MGQVVSFERILPPARYDTVAWAEVRIEEAATSLGPWTQIDAVALPADPDPADPQLQSFSTAEGTGDALWYRVIFADGTGNVSAPSDPVQNVSGGDPSRNLCTLADVLGYVPGYESDAVTNTKLQAFISAESRTIHHEAGREFVAAIGSSARRFDVPRRPWIGVLRIGDCAAVDSVSVLDEFGNTVSTVASTAYQPLPLNREEWEPIRRLRFVAGGALSLTSGRSVLVTATWGFPSIPPDVREACAKRVILRYLTDVAASGTAFADAIRESDINFAALFRSAQQVVDDYSQALVA